MAREENPGESTGEKKRNEPEREKHGRVELDPRVPKGAEPTDQEDCCGQPEGRSQQREDERRKRIHTAGKHVLSPDAKTEEADGAKRENDEALFPDRLAGKRGNEMRDEAEARKHGHVDFGLGEKPEEALPKNGNGVGDDAGRLSGNEIQQRKKVGAQEAIGEQADAGGEKNAED